MKLILGESDLLCHSISEQIVAIFNCIQDIKLGMAENFLQLNLEKKNCLLVVKTQTHFETTSTDIKPLSAGKKPS